MFVIVLYNVHKCVHAKSQFINNFKKTDEKWTKC